ncbi:copper resistance protein CopC [Neobacillus drentensis]|uniref:copper resistance CopC family protein n=1 Tax=Neobacillus drentensis TaxID=220684 RepID=UPI0030006328
MKKILTILSCLLMILPSIASAHTELTNSYPAEHQVIKEELEEVVLTYEGKIESLSTMKLVKDGQGIPLASVTPKENQLIGTLPNPLENGTYTIQWSIAGEDGHPITGEVPFSVQKEVKQEQTETKTPVTTKNDETKKENEKQEQTNEQPTASSSIFKNIITVVVLVILVVGGFLLLRRKG